MLEVELWVVVDSEGNAECHISGEEEAMERFADEIGGNSVRRCIKITLSVPAPKPIELRGAVPEEACEGTELTVA